MRLAASASGSFPSVSTCSFNPIVLTELHAFCSVSKLGRRSAGAAYRIRIYSLRLMPLSTLFILPNLDIGILIMNICYAFLNQKFGVKEVSSLKVGELEAFTMKVV